MTEQVRVRVDALTERGRVALKHALGLTDDELARLKPPFEAQMAELSASRRGRLEAESVSLSPARVAFEPCSLHTKLAKDQTCSRCRERTCAACVSLVDAKVCPDCARSLRRRGTFRAIRVTALLVVLALVALSTYAQRRAIRGWRRPISVVIVPLAYDADSETVAYAASVPRATYDPVVGFLSAEAKRYGVDTELLLEVTVDRTVSDAPPLPPEAPGVFDAIVFSLRLRWYAFNLDSDADIRLFVLYHAPTPGKSVPHSLGLERGHVGIVHAFAGAKHEAHNAVVLTHELLHTAGASDKYDASGAPVHPDGYADPEAAVQTKAELMAISIPTPRGPRPAQNLAECVVGVTTAAEIGWLEAAAVE